MIPVPPQKGGVVNNPYVKPPRTNPGGVVTNPYSNPNPRPMTVDYATPSLYQTNAAYQGVPPVTIPGDGGHGGHGQSSAPPRPQVSSFAATPPTPTQPITPNSTGQFGVSAGSSPFNAVQQEQQIQTTTGKAATPKPAPVAKKKAAPKKKASSLDKYLSKDSDYQNTIRDLNRALADFKARQGVEKTRAGTENSYAQRVMGLQSQQDLSDIQNDAAARGIVTSGVYGQRVGDYNTSYNEQLAELGRQYKAQLDDFASALADFTRQQSLQKESARTAAIRRRSAKLGKVS